MFSLKYFRLLRYTKPSYSLLRCFHHEFSKPESVTDKHKKLSSEPTNLAGAVSKKYKEFRDEDSLEIFDIEEERQRYQTKDQTEMELDDQYLGLNLQRGLHGVFDIEDLVEVLRRESAEDIFVCSIPKEMKYVDYLVVCTGRSYRHMLSTAEFVRRIYKIKRNRNEILPKIEGEKSKNWMALDLGNIALHIFSADAREEYDLESLWAIGSQYDRESNKQQQSLVDLFAEHSLLNELSNENNINSTK